MAARIAARHGGYEFLIAVTISDFVSKSVFADVARELGACDSIYFIQSESCKRSHGRARYLVYTANHAKNKNPLDEAANGAK